MKFPENIERAALANVAIANKQIENLLTQARVGVAMAAELDHEHLVASFRPNVRRISAGECAERSTESLDDIRLAARHDGGMPSKLERNVVDARR
jgi:hypothetical protein